LKQEAEAALGRKMSLVTRAQIAQIHLRGRPDESEKKWGLKKRKGPKNRVFGKNGSEPWKNTLYQHAEEGGGVRTRCKKERRDFDQNTAGSTKKGDRKKKKKTY